MDSIGMAGESEIEFGQQEVDDGLILPLKTKRAHALLALT